MLFTEPRFILFFVAVWALYWCLPDNRARKAVLLIASYGFYACWDWRFLSLILFSTGVDYVVALRLGREAVETRRRLLLMVSLASNLGLLFVFKYFNFFADSAADLLALFGAEATHTTLNIVLPVGISFYTFQTLSYTIDVYKRQLEPRHSLLDVAFFVAFFPQLVAGPIVRASTFLPQLDAKRRLADVPLQACLLLFLLGFFKKAVISDNVAPYVDEVFAAPGLYAASAIVGAALFYAVQIYCDFSGYSDMAIAVSALLGYRLPRNFAAPYFAADITDFWRRWHISLSGWLRDYLYVPLGGSRGGVAKTYRNLMLTMLLGGLWHGAGMNFIFWGFLHGLALVLHKEWRLLMPRLTGHLPRMKPVLRPLGLGLGMALTFYWVCLAWIFFRQGDWEAALYMAYVFTTLDAVGVRTLDVAWPWIVLVLGALHALLWRARLELRAERMPRFVFAAAYGASAALAIGLIPMEYRPFVYFQF